MRFFFLFLFQCFIAAALAISMLSTTKTMYRKYLISKRFTLSHTIMVMILNSDMLRCFELVFCKCVHTKSQMNVEMNENVGNSIYGHRFTCCFLYIRHVNIVQVNLKFYVAFLNFTIGF